MRYFLLIIITLLCTTGFSQESTSQTLPLEDLEIIATQCTGLEITFYEGSSTVSMSGIDNTKFLAAGLDSIPPKSLNTKNTAYIMIIVNDDFYMSAELSFGENKYLIFNKNETLYYNKLNEQGEYFFKQVLGE